MNTCTTLIFRGKYHYFIVKHWNIHIGQSPFGILKTTCVSYGTASYILQWDLLYVIWKFIKVSELSNWCNCLVDVANTLIGKHTQVIDMHRLNQPAFTITLCSVENIALKPSGQFWGLGQRADHKKNTITNSASTRTLPLCCTIVVRKHGWFYIGEVPAFVRKGLETALDSGEVTTASSQASCIAHRLSLLQCLDVTTECFTR